MKYLLLWRWWWRCAYKYSSQLSQVVGLKVSELRSQRRSKQVLVHLVMKFGSPFKPVHINLYMPFFLQATRIYFSKTLCKVVLVS